MPNDITVRNLCIVDRLANRTLVHGVDFSVTKGKVLAIVGESGSGKSISCMSLIKLLPANLSISADMLDVDGHDLRDGPKAKEIVARIRGHKVAIIFQDPMSALDPLARVGSQLIDIVSFNQKISRKQAYAVVLGALQHVQIRNSELVMSQFPFQLSGGMLQRASIALAIACKPDYIIADEPTTALDPSVQKDILDLLMQLKRDLDIGFLFITHDFGVVSYVADQICVMQEGEIVESGAAKAVMQAPRHAYTRKLLDAVPRFSAVTTTNTEAENVAPRTDSPPPPILTIDHVVFSYDKRKNPAALDDMVLKDVSLAVRKGGSMGIVGESGSGKSTLMKLALGIYRPQTGAIALDGQDVYGYTRRDFSKKVQPVFQNPGTALNPAKRVIDVVAAPLLAQGCGKSEAHRKARETLDAVGILARFDDAIVVTLSGGQKQRVAIARAIVSDPEVLLCDEPTSALDVSIQAQVIALLKTLRREFNLTMVFISHNLGVVGQLCESLAVIEQGRVVEQGDTARIFTSPEHPYTRKLMDAMLI